MFVYQGIWITGALTNAHGLRMSLNVVSTIRAICRKGKSMAKMYVGHVVQRKEERPVLKVQTTMLKLDKRLKMFFNSKNHYWVYDNKMDCLVGDIVLIKPLTSKQKRKSGRVSHKVDSIVFKLGKVIDPVTGKRCRGTSFVDEDKDEDIKLVIEEVD